MDEEKIHATLSPSGVVVLTIDNPPMNALHPIVLKELFTKLSTNQNDAHVKAIVITGASGKFTAGFDVQLFRDSEGQVPDVSKDVNRYFCELIESGQKPTVAAIDGVCLGGGCELSVACNGRVCTPSSKIGLPELQLGIIPGFGGTQRLPRLVGLKKGLEMMLTSRPLSGKDAKMQGLVDAVCSRDDLLSVAVKMALDMVDGKRPRVKSLEQTDKLEPFSEALQICDFAHMQATKRAPSLQHPHFCIDAIRYGIEHGGAQGLVQEYICFGKCLGLDTHKALVHVFFSIRATKRLKGVTDIGLSPRRIHRVGVLGGGLMGSGIVTALILAGYGVVLKEVNEKFLKSGLDRIDANLQSAVKKGKISEKAAKKASSLVQGVLDYGLFGNVDLVIEAALENVILKQEIFADLEKVCRKDCILATNTSTIDIKVVGDKTRAADRIVGAHFFSPAHLMPLLEIVRSDKTSNQVLVDLLEVSSRIKKTPVVVGNCTGFAVNRVFFPYTMAACLLVDLGLDPYRIDKAIAAFGMPLGPFKLMDLVGADIGMHVGENFVEAFPDRVYITQLLVLMNKYNRLGQKTGKGFYTLKGPSQGAPDPEVASIVQESREASGIMTPSSKPPRFSDQDIVEFIFFPVVNEGCRVVGESIVSKASDLDIASILGMGFPTYRGGLMFWADIVGASHILDRLDAFMKLFPKHASFFQPCQYLQKCAAMSTTLENGPLLHARL